MDILTDKGRMFDFFLYHKLVYLGIPRVILALSTQGLVEESKE